MKFVCTPSNLLPFTPLLLLPSPLSYLSHLSSPLSSLSLLSLTVFDRYKWHNTKKIRLATINIGILGTLLSLAITHLKINDEFDYQHFPYSPSLAHLTFGGNFHQPVPALTLLSLTHLTFRVYFNQNVDSVPPSLPSFLWRYF